MGYKEWMESADGVGILRSCLECFHLLHLDVIAVHHSYFNEGLIAVNLATLHPTGAQMMERHPNRDERPRSWNTSYQIWSRLISQLPPH